MDEQPTPVKPRGTIIKNIYLYLVSFVALMMLVFSVANLVDTALRAFVFTKADENFFYGGPICTPATPEGTTTTGKPAVSCVTADEQKKQNEEQRSAQRQSNVVRDLSFILVATPVFLYHWRIIRNREEQ